MAISQPVCGLASAAPCAPLRSSGSPSPGRSQLTTTSPMISAKVVTTSKYSNDLAPMRPTALRSPVWAMPTTMVENRSGTMRPLMSAMNARDMKRKVLYAVGY